VIGGFPRGVGRPDGDLRDGKVENKPRCVDRTLPRAAPGASRRSSMGFGHRDQPILGERRTPRSTKWEELRRQRRHHR
jgi:hypothetical protein